MALPIYYKIKSLFTDLTLDLYHAMKHGRIDDVRTIVRFIDKSILNKPYYAFGFFKDNRQMRNRTFLMDSAEKGYAYITKIFLEAGAKPNLIDENGATAISLAALRADEQTVTILLEHGASTIMGDVYDRTPLMHALFNGNIDPARALIKETKSIDAVDSNKRSALMYSVERGSLTKECTKDLIRAKANLDLQDSQGRTALMIAYKKNEFGVQALIDAGANLDLQDKSGRTVLMMAVERGDGYEPFIEAKANLDLQDDIGDTAFIMAARENKIEIMNALIAAGANQDIRNKFNKTARDYIQQNADVSAAEKKTATKSLAGSDFMKANVDVEASITDEAGSTPMIELATPKVA